MLYDIDHLRAFIETSGLNMAFLEEQIHIQAKLNLPNFNAIQKTDFGDEQIQDRIFVVKDCGSNDYR